MGEGGIGALLSESSEALWLLRICILFGEKLLATWSPKCVCQSNNKHNFLSQETLLLYLTPRKNIVVNYLKGFSVPKKIQIIYKMIEGLYLHK